MRTLKRKGPQFFKDKIAVKAQGRSINRRDDKKIPFSDKKISLYFVGGTGSKLNGNQ
ncbi:hypothetical protein [Gloeocapsopsis dulcis]|uniref:hypothetical protein n=1 Tax=Gloeocapsopsis dulcis TaxID=2859516 RepID=UPI0012DAA244|nr:hypothetical protein [Gloeocapsopsis dulcis]